jgi:hypothetical protein
MNNRKEKVWECMSPQNRDVFGEFQSQKLAEDTIDGAVAARLLQYKEVLEEAKAEYERKQKEYNEAKASLEKMAKEMKEMKDITINLEV